MVNVDDRDIDLILRGYVHAATWADLVVEREGEPDNPDMGSEAYEFGPDDVVDADLSKLREYIEDFAEANWALIEAYCEHPATYNSDGGDIPECVGHDLYLTSAGPGAGFWDRGLGELGDKLTEASKHYGVNMVWLDVDGETVHID